MRRKYTRAEYFSALLLSCGLCVLTLVSASSHHSSAPASPNINIDVNQNIDDIANNAELVNNEGPSMFDIRGKLSSMLYLYSR